MSTPDEMISTSAKSDNDNREKTNQIAWDRLYASTAELVWGDTDLPFVTEAIHFLCANHFLVENPAILDAASGEGRNLPALLRASANVTACDSSAAGLEKLKSRFENRVETVECDLARMPFAGDSFDLVLACDIIETLPNLHDVLLEIARILRPGGVLIANVPDFDDSISDKDMKPLSDNEFLYQGSYFFRFQNETEFLGILEQCGFSLISSKSTTWWEPPHPGYRNDVHSHTSRIILASRKIV